MMNKTLDEILAEIKRQFEQKENYNVYGEPRAFIYLDNERRIEITHEEDGLSPNEYFFSARLEYAEEEFENFHYGAEYGVIEIFDTINTLDPLDVEPLREAIECLLKVNEINPLNPMNYLSKEVCLGVLSRAEKSNKKLPSLLKKSLESRIQQNF